MTIRDVIGKEVDSNHITNKKRKHNLSLVDTWFIDKEYDILESEEKYIESKGDSIVDIKDVDKLIKILLRFIVVGATRDLSEFEDVIRGKTSPHDITVELDDFGGYANGANYVDYKDAMHIDLSTMLIKRLQTLESDIEHNHNYKDKIAEGDMYDAKPIKYNEILDCLVY